MLFYQIVKKNECDSQRPCWCALGGSKIYHLKRGVSKQYFCMFYASSSIVLPYDLHLVGYQGHIDNFKVIRVKTKKYPLEQIFCYLNNTCDGYLTGIHGLMNK